MAPRSGEALQDNTAGIKSVQAINVGGGDVTLTRVSRGIYVGASGNITVQFVSDNSSVTLVGLAAGVWHPMQVQAVLQSGTTATGIFAGF